MGHGLYDTERGVGKNLQSDSTNAQGNDSSVLLSDFNSNGFTVKSDASVNQSGASFASWTFRKAPKFFDVVTYTGNNGYSQSIAHPLGRAPGMVIVKAYTVDNSSEDLWYVYHIGASGTLRLNTTAAQDPYKYCIGSAGATTFSVSQFANKSGLQYVAYLFAHDPSADGIIQCGSFTTDASGNATVNLGWEPQWLLVKSTNISQNWQIVDVMREFSNRGYAAIYPNMNSAESVTTGNSYLSPTATGFKTGPVAAVPGSSAYIYLAIRRPMKVPTSGTKVYKPTAWTGTNGTASESGVGFAPLS